MATVTIQRAEPVETPISSVTLVMSEDEARALTIVVGHGTLGALRQSNPDVYAPLAELETALGIED